MTDSASPPFRTGDSALAGAITYWVTMPRNLWFQSAFHDAIGAMCEYFNWQKWGDQDVAPAVEASNAMFIRMRPMIGLMFPAPTATVPDGCLICDGTTYQREDYPDLYAVLGAAYILNADEFYVPDCRAKVIAGVGNYDGVDFIEFEFIGESAHTLVESELPSHLHTVHDHIPSLALEPGEMVVSSPNPFDNVTGFTGNDQAHNNIQPTIVLNWVIVAR